MILCISTAKTATKEYLIYSAIIMSLKKAHDMHDT